MGYDNLRMQKKITFNRENENNLFVNERQAARVNKDGVDDRKLDKNGTPRNGQRFDRNLMNIPQISPIRNVLDRSQISHIEYK